jgi:hypothetical protein
MLGNKNMHAITDQEVRLKAEPVLRKVLVNNDPFGETFSSVARFVVGLPQPEIPNLA